MKQVHLPLAIEPQEKGLERVSDERVLGCLWWNYTMPFPPFYKVSGQEVYLILAICVCICFFICFFVSIFFFYFFFFLILYRFDSFVFL